jgi:hypothetical protein
MRDIGVALRFGNGRRPRFDGGTVDVDGSAAHPAKQMMMVRPGSTLAEKQFARVVAKDVEIARVGQTAQLVVDGREADALAPRAQQLMQVLGRAKRVNLGEQVGQRALLSG